MLDVNWLGVVDGIVAYFLVQCAEVMPCYVNFEQRSTLTFGLVTLHRRSISLGCGARLVVVRTSLTECSVCYGQVVEMRCPYLYRYLLAALIHARHLRTWSETLTLAQQTCNACSAL